MNKIVLALIPCLLFLQLTNCSPAALAQPSSQSPSTEKTVYLTFDDGPTDSTTPYILDILKTENVRATFFVIGRQINGRENILRREHTDGHKIAIHTYSHEYGAIYASRDALLKDIEKCRKAILNILPDWNESLYRFPGGSSGVREELRLAVQKAGWHAVDWNSSAEDAVRPDASAEELYQYVLDSSAKKKDIILLMHDGVGYKATIQCLPRVIKHFKDIGYTFRTL